MTVSIILEHRFQQSPDGHIWTSTQFPYSFWTRYLDVFDRVRVVARVQRVNASPSNAHRCDGDAVSFATVPYFLGAVQFAKLSRRVRASVETAITPGGALILRVPSTIGDFARRYAHRRGQPYGVEVVGDPYAVYAPGAMRHPLRALLRWSMPRQLRDQCAGACGVGYVSRSDLPKRYPCPGTEAMAAYYSSVELTTDHILQLPRIHSAETRATNLVTVGSLGQLYKGTDVLLDAVAKCVADGFALRLLVIGDGRHRKELENRADALGVTGYVKFVGQIPAGAAVRRHLDDADLFVLPSRTEGLPRAMIEAMARGLPCIGTRVGGIPELLPPEAMVPPGDVQALAMKIAEVISDPARMTNMSEQNLAKAEEYREDVLRHERNKLYRHIREATEKWLSRQPLST